MIESVETGKCSPCCSSEPTGIRTCSTLSRNDLISGSLISKIFIFDKSSIHKLGYKLSIASDSLVQTISSYIDFHRNIYVTIIFVSFYFGSFRYTRPQLTSSRPSKYNFTASSNVIASKLCPLSRIVSTLSFGDT